MSLATRCFACGTVFRVVQDQLKVSEGWVRCGRCNEVFNALDSLFDLERDNPPAWSPGSPLVEEAPTDVAEEPAPQELSTAPVSEPSESLVDRIDAHLQNSWRSNSSPSARVNERDRLDFPDAQFDPEFSLGMLSDASNETATTLPLSSESVPPPSSATTPDFVRHAQQRARWQRPAARMLLAATGLLLLAALGLQAGHHFRDVVAARWPATKPALVTWCETWACSIQAPRRIDDIAVESTALARASEPDAFKLMVTLRNRGPLAFAMPSVDLSLTDATGQLVTRRVLSPGDLRVGSASIPPGADVPLQAVLTAGSARVTGYTVEIFYP
jgi:predicted Zn finger-like uncharacterized protein